MTLPSEILAFKLIRKANITNEKLLILTGITMRTKAICMRRPIISKKFKAVKSSSNAAVKLEPAFLADNEDALLQGETR